MIDASIEKNNTDYVDKQDDATLELAKAYTDQEIGKLSNTVDADATATDLVTNEIAVVTGVTVTQENGKFIILGLEKGTYYLKETKAPDGYTVKTDATPIVVGETTPSQFTTSSICSVWR